MTLKVIHVGCVYLSICGFLLRGYWLMTGSRLLQARLTKILPHIIDTLLLVSAIAMAVMWQLSPLDHLWLLAKIILLVVYILLGMAMLKWSKTRNMQILSGLSAIVVYALIFWLAVARPI